MTLITENCAYPYNFTQEVKWDIPPLTLRWASLSHRRGYQFINTHSSLHKHQFIKRTCYSLPSSTANSYLETEPQPPHMNDLQILQAPKSFHEFPQLPSRLKLCFVLRHGDQLNKISDGNHKLAMCTNCIVAPLLGNICIRISVNTWPHLASGKDFEIFIR